MLGEDIQNLSVEVVRVSPDILHVKIGAPARWEVPKKVFVASNVTGTAIAQRPCPILGLVACSSPCNVASGYICFV